MATIPAKSIFLMFLVQKDTMFLGEFFFKF